MFCGTKLSVFCSAAAILLFASACSAQCPQTPRRRETVDAFLSRCEESGGRAGNVTYRAGCATLKSRCPVRIETAVPKSRAAFSAGPPGVSPEKLFEQAVNQTCISLFKTKCMNQATTAAFELDTECGDLLTLGPTLPVDGCNNETEARNIFFEEVRTLCDQVTLPNECKCAQNGISNCVRTKRRGCKKHLIRNNDPDRFCYVKDSSLCPGVAFPSEMFKGAYWMLC